jgi:hypothetical protein
LAEFVVEETPPYSIDTFLIGTNMQAAPSISILIPTFQMDAILHSVNSARCRSWFIGYRLDRSRYHSRIESAMEWGQEYGIEVIPGVEISAEHPSGCLHILGYFIDVHNEGFQVF